MAAVRNDSHGIGERGLTGRGPGAPLSCNRNDNIRQYHGCMSMSIDGYRGAERRGS